MTIELEQVASLFREQFGRAPEVGAWAPGRVNLIGEHTDYNHGFVLPMAIERKTAIVAARRRDRNLDAFSATFGRRVFLSLDTRTRNAAEPWIDYVVGVADQLARLGMPLVGADLVIGGDVPIGAGLSSSASLEMAALAMFEALGGFSLEGAEGPKLCQRVENEFLGVNSGIMDQFVARFAKGGHALFLDSRNLVYEQIPVAFPGATFVIANTGVSRGLAASKYNERVEECHHAVRILGRCLNRSGTHLRDFVLEELDSCRDKLPEIVYRRARHVMRENARTLAACAAMCSGDVAELGRLMNDSDESLRKDYEVTCEELDRMTELARRLEGCYGARMTGAGFGGCTVNLVATDRTESFAHSLLDAYNRRTGLNGEIIISAPGNGSGVLSL